VANIRLHHLERLLRHPACPLCCAAAIESNRPFGVVTARRTLAMPAAVIVWPARAGMRVPDGLVATAGVGQEMSERITGHSGDSIAARDYREGDPMPSIHWAHTARRDTLVVRERPGAAAAPPQPPASNPACTATADDARTRPLGKVS